MRKVILLFAIFLCGAFLCSAPAKADYFNYPCNYPFVGVGGGVDSYACASGGIEGGDFAG